MTLRLSPPAAAFLASRLLVLLAAYIGLLADPLDVATGQWQAFPDARWLDGLVRWDAGWYWTIVDRGYYFDPNEPSNVAFFPLVPSVSWALATPLRLAVAPDRAFYLAGIALSHAAFYAALVAIWRIARAHFDDPTAAFAVWLVALYPFSLFFSTPYTEASYLALSAWSFWFAHRGRWLPACALASLAAVCRTVGFLIAVGLFAEYVSRCCRDRRFAARDALWFAITPALVVALMIWFWVRFDSPTVFVDTQRHWGRDAGIHHLALALEAMASAPGDLRLLFGWYLVSLGAAVSLGFVAWRRLGPGYAVATIASAVPVIATGISSSGRYVSVLFPVFLVAASLARPRWLRAGILVLFAVHLWCFTHWYAHWHLVN